jgi:phosphoglucosamine mutase
MAARSADGCAAWRGDRPGRKATRPVKLILGRDTRESGAWIERELARGASSQGAVVTSAGVLPTPGVAFLARAHDFDLGVVLSASHNPYGDNGIKVFSGHGEKFGERDERVIEAIMADPAWRVGNASAGQVHQANFVEEYLDHVRRLFPATGALNGARIAVDMANGATTSTARSLFTSPG